MRDVYFLGLLLFLSCSSKEVNNETGESSIGSDTLFIVTNAASQHSALERQAQTVYFGDNAKGVPKWSLNRPELVTIRTRLLPDYPLKLRSDGALIEVIDSLDGKFLITPQSKSFILELYRYYGPNGTVLSFTDYDSAADSVFTDFPKLNGTQLVSETKIDVVTN